MHTSQLRLPLNMSIFVRSLTAELDVNQMIWPVWFIQLSKITLNFQVILWARTGYNYRLRDIEITVSSSQDMSESAFCHKLPGVITENPVAAVCASGARGRFLLLYLSPGPEQFDLAEMEIFVKDLGKSKMTPILLKLIKGSDTRAKSSHITCSKTLSPRLQNGLHIEVLEPPRHIFTTSGGK